MKSVMAHSFSQVPKAEIPRSQFNRSHGFKTTFDAGVLVPFYVDEALPGDTFNLKLTSFARLSTPIVPFMDNLFLDTFFFAVPYRLVWDNWQKFNGEQTDPGDSTDYLIPTITSPSGSGYGVGTIYDYMGIPTQVPGLEHSALWLRAYNLIWNEWFRDQNLQDSAPINRGDGPDAPTDYAIIRRGKRHDYFTSSLPWPQKGPSVSIPLGTSAPVGSKEVAGVFQPVHWTTGSGANSIAGSMTMQNAGGSSQILDSANNIVAMKPDGNVIADLTSATAATINQLRQAFQIQKLYERDARGGTRYTEIIQSHFGVTSPDARLQRPEYLGGGSKPITINPVVQTSGTPTAGTPQGNLAAFGVVHSSGNGFVKSFTEHTLLIGLMSVRADLNYQQGLNRMWSRQTRFDFYWPALSHLGEQAVLNKEIYAVGSSNLTQDEAVFGYQERYAEYRYKPSLITGQFRSSFAQTLDIWHLAQNFTALPTLGETFIEDNPPIARVIAVPSEPAFLYDSFIQITTARPMPTYSVPGLIDHF